MGRLAKAQPAETKGPLQVVEGRSQGQVPQPRLSLLRTPPGKDNPWPQLPPNLRGEPAAGTQWDWARLSSWPKALLK